MVEISRSKQMRASVDVLWDILSDMDNEGKYWTNIRDVKILSRDGNMIEREANVGPRSFSQKSRQTIVLDPKRSVKLTIIGDNMDGERTVSLFPAGREATRVDVNWSLRLKNVPGFVESIVKNQIAKATDDALSKVAKEAESRASHATSGRVIRQ